MVAFFVGINKHNMDYLKEISRSTQLEDSWEHVKRKRKVTPGVDSVHVSTFGESWRKEKSIISDSVKSGKYKFQKVILKKIPKKTSSEKRPIRIYTVRDKVVQTSMRLSIEKSFPETINSVSIGYIDSNKFEGDSVGVKRAIERIKNASKLDYKYFVTADIQDFFEKIDRKRLEKIIATRMKPTDGFIELVRASLKPEVIALDKYGKRSELADTGSGVAQGSVISPLYSNIYLFSFDQELERRGILAIRYADDVLLMAKTMNQAKKALRISEEILFETTRLLYHPKDSEKCAKIHNIYTGVEEYLGVYIQKTNMGKKWLVRPSDKKISLQKKKIVSALNPQREEDLYTRLDYLNRSLYGWRRTYEYAKCTPSGLAKIHKELFETYIHHVEHLMSSRGIQDKHGNPLSKSQIQFLGILPPNRKKRKFSVW